MCRVKKSVRAGQSASWAPAARRPWCRIDPREPSIYKKRAPELCVRYLHRCHTKVLTLHPKPRDFQAIRSTTRSTPPDSRPHPYSGYRAVPGRADVVRGMPPVVAGLSGIRHRSRASRSSLFCALTSADAHPVLRVSSACSGASRLMWPSIARTLTCR